MSDERLINWLRLARLPGVGAVLVKRLLEAFGTPERVLSAHPSNLAAVEGIGTVRANQVVAGAAGTLEAARRELEAARRMGVDLITPEEERFPAGLRHIADPPVVLYVRGEIRPADALAVGIVGARRCTLYGQEQATRIAAELAEAGLTIVSGGARGIDSCAHLGALRAKGRTLVIQGCGLGHTYPPENAGLFARIVEEGAGAIVTELPLDAPPNKENFPPRNRIIAALGLGILVVEANLKSGSLITARLAAADYGREVFALPGRVDSPASAGTHHLIKAGMAHLVESAADVLEYLGEAGEVLKRETRNAKLETAGAGAEAGDGELFLEAAVKEETRLTETQRRIVDAIGSGEANVDELVERTGLAAQVIMAELTLLQIQKVLVRGAGNRFGRGRGD